MELNKRYVGDKWNYNLGDEPLVLFLICEIRVAFICILIV